MDTKNKAQTISRMTITSWLSTCQATMTLKPKRRKNNQMVKHRTRHQGDQHEREDSFGWDLTKTPITFKTPSSARIMKNGRQPWRVK